jgi:hypothetical protein
MLRDSFSRHGNDDAAAIVNSAPIDPDFQQGCSHSGPLDLPVCYGAPGGGFMAQRTVRVQLYSCTAVRYFWDAALDQCVIVWGASSGVIMVCVYSSNT